MSILRLHGACSIAASDFGGKVYAGENSANTSGQPNGTVWRTAEILTSTRRFGLGCLDSRLRNKETSSGTKSSWLCFLLFAIYDVAALIFWMRRSKIEG
jgi:hypothetical protein